MTLSGHKRSTAWQYLGNRSVPPAQALLKSSLVPLAALDGALPRAGVILDLGCGEGILANLVAAIRPGCTIVGIDRSEAQIARARANARANARFVTGDILELGDDYRDVAAVILNDVVHHQAYAAHQPLILDVLQRLRPDGVLVLKEVDQADRADASMTRFFDSRLYPDDPLCFRSQDEWLDLFARLGADNVAVHRVRHFWPASRTVFVARRPPTVFDPVTHAAGVGEDNLAQSRSHTVVFVTGAAGFLGRHLCRSLLTDGLDGRPVRLVYLSRNPHRRSADLSNAVPVYGDLDDLPRLAAGLRGIDYVFHLAAEKKLTGGIDVRRNNYHGTVALMHALQGSDVKSGVKRVVHTSSIGAVDRRPADDCGAPLTEDSPPHPLSEYGLTKLESERAVQESGLPYAILRVTWGFGAGMTPETHVRFLTNGVARRRLFSRIAFPGKVSVTTGSDIAQAFRLLATHPDAANQAFFVSNGQPLALGQLFRLYASVLGRPHRMVALPSVLVKSLRRVRRFLPLQVQALVSDVITADPGKLFALGFRPAVSVREGLIELARDQGHLPPATFDEPRRPVSVVTGAAGGIGRALAHRLRHEGHGLLLIDKNEEPLRVLAQALDAQALPLDLNAPAADEALDCHLTRQHLYVDWMINNAGIGVRGETVELDAARVHQVIDVNCSALVTFSQLFLRHTARSHVGTLINIGSSSGFQPLPFMAVYAASKAFVQSFTLALMGERDGARVVLVDPSGTDTGFQAAAGAAKPANERLLSADTVAQMAIESVYRGRQAVVVGRRGQAMALVSRLLPRTAQVRLWGRLMASLR